MRKSILALSLALSISAAVPAFAARQNTAEPQGRQTKETSIRQVIRTIIRHLGVLAEPTVPIPKDLTVR
ncbi:MAG TPA: hypothetical protein VF618_24080 [Thermoanaerobaculia bacterium]